MSELPLGWETTTIGAVTEPYESVDPRKSPERTFRYVDMLNRQPDTLNHLTKSVSGAGRPVSGEAYHPPRRHALFDRTNLFEERYHRSGFA
jgi:hypothetical protein